MGRRWSPTLLLERKGARVVLCAAAGATDLLELRRQERASLYDLSAQHPAPLVPQTTSCLCRAHCRGVPANSRRRMPCR
ncbi:MAG: hydantoinase/oxoprolinase N-terminal domain-containing protein [Gemmatimonadaceae bacterium]